VRQSIVTETWIAGPALVVRWGERFAYPRFQFPTGEPPESHETVQRLRTPLDYDRDPAGAIGWWLTASSWLGARPADLLGTAREAEIEYAVEQLANDSW